MRKIQFHKLIPAAFALCTFALAQPAHALLNLGALGGVNISTESIDNANMSASSGFGFMFGAGLDFGLWPVDLTADLMFAHRVVSLTSSGVSANYSENRMEIPVLANFGVGPVMLEGGAYYSFGLGNVNAGGTSVSYSAASLNSNDLGLTFGLGAKLMSLSAEARFNLGLLNVSSVSPVTIHNRSFDFLVGYWF